MSLLLLLPVKTRFPRRLRCNEEEDEEEVEGVEACKEMSKLSFPGKSCFTSRCEDVFEVIVVGMLLLLVLLRLLPLPLPTGGHSLTGLMQVKQYLPNMLESDHID